MIIYAKRSVIKSAKQRGILYHSTTFEGLYAILQSNKLRANGPDPGDGDGDDHGIGVSLTRDPDFRITSGYNVVLALDGDKLSNDYEIKPVAGGASLGDDGKFEWITEPGADARFVNTQHEERVYTGEILEVNKYLKKILIDNTGDIFTKDGYVKLPIEWARIVKKEIPGARILKGSWFYACDYYETCEAISKFTGVPVDNKIPVSKSFRDTKPKYGL